MEHRERSGKPHLISYYNGVQQPGNTQQYEWILAGCGLSLTMTYWCRLTPAGMTTTGSSWPPASTHSPILRLVSIFTPTYNQVPLLPAINPCFSTKQQESPLHTLFWCFKMTTIKISYCKAPVKALLSEGPLSTMTSGHSTWWVFSGVCVRLGTERPCIFRLSFTVTL